jgi:hypothetical protein
MAPAPSTVRPSRKSQTHGAWVPSSDPRTQTANPLIKVGLSPAAQDGLGQLAIRNPILVRYLIESQRMAALSDDSVNSLSVILNLGGMNSRNSCEPKATKNKREPFAPM